MVHGWLLGIILAVFGVMCGVALYFLQQKQLHHALWSGFVAIVLLSLVIALHLRNHIILSEEKDALKPEIKVGIFPDDDPYLNPFRYPFQEYHIHISKEKKESLPAHGLTVKFYFPYLVSEAKGGTYVHAGEKVFTAGFRMYKRNKNGVTATKGIPAETALDKSMSFSVEKWQEDDKPVNSNIVVFNCDRWTELALFVGSIVVDLSRKQKIVMTPDEIGTYTGEYYYEFKGKKLPPIKISGVIPEPDLDKKLAEHHYDQGMELLKKDECNQSIIEFTAAINFNSKHAHAYFKRAYCHGNLGNYDKAILDFDRAVEILPKYSKAYFYRAIAKKNRGDPNEDIENDFLKACDLGFKKGCREYWSSKLSTVNPSDGWFSFQYSEEKWLEANNEFIEIIPHVLRNNFEIHVYRDKDNVFKALISNAFSKKSILQYKDLERLKNASTHPKHEIKIGWFKGENKLYIDGVLVDVYPKKIDSSLVKLKERLFKVGKSDGDIFRALYNIGPEKGRIGFSISKEDWLNNNGEFINIFPHIYISEQNFEVHGYRDEDFVFKFLFSTSYSRNVILQFSDLEGLKNDPLHPRHFIQVAWHNEQKELYINKGEPIDIYPRK